MNGKGAVSPVIADIRSRMKRGKIVSIDEAMRVIRDGDTVSIDASATTDDTPEKLTYKWNLGDGTSAEGSRVSHTYAKGGTYTVH